MFNRPKQARLLTATLLLTFSSVLGFPAQAQTQAPTAAATPSKAEHWLLPKTLTLKGLIRLFSRIFHLSVCLV